jgi:4-coumarate--CoA ligase
LQELIKYKGLQIAPAEIEGLLIEHPEIMEAAVVGVPEPSASQHTEETSSEAFTMSEVPRAYVVRMPKSRISEDTVKDFVKERLAQYKHLRGGVVFIDELPKNALGKILRRELRDKAMVEVRGERSSKI